MPPIELLAHRGWWDHPAQRNTLPALQRAFAAGLGVETDLRDCAGELVISHDPPLPGALTFRALLKAYARANRPGHLALNIKSDGLQPLVHSLLQEFSITRYFLFDMSIPDTLAWLNAGLPTFTRHSDIEPTPVLYDRSAGIWLDGFSSEWYSAATVRQHLSAGKHVAVISPEIHGRDPAPVWAILKELATDDQTHPDAPHSAPAAPPHLFLCTDRIPEARSFFHA